MTEDDEPYEMPPARSQIRLMAEEGCWIPLWGNGELMFMDPDELVQATGVTTELAEDIKAWSIDWQPGKTVPEHDARAAELVRRLNRELEYRYNIVYQP